MKPPVKRGKTDAADAEAIAEAVTRPTMRFVAVRTVDQQTVLMRHKTRDLLVRQRIMLINALRGHLAEQASLPELARSALRRLVGQIEDVEDEVRKIGEGDRRLMPDRSPGSPLDDGSRRRADHRKCDLGSRLIGTSIADFVRASGHEHRVNGPDT